MAEFEPHDETKMAELDLHEYATGTALGAMWAKIEEAWLNGWVSITVIHGAPYAETIQAAMALDRGSIKFAIKDLLESGEFNRFVDEYKLGPGSTSITLKVNPNPRSALWSEVPDTENFDHWSGTGPKLPPYAKQKAEADAEAIVLAIVQDRPHPAVTKREDRWVVTMVRAIPNAESASQTTLSGQRRRLKEAIIRKIEDYPQFEQSDSGSQLAFRLRSG